VFKKKFFFFFLEKGRDNNFFFFFLKKGKEKNFCFLFLKKFPLKKKKNLKLLNGQAGRRACPVRLPFQ